MTLLVLSTVLWIDKSQDLTSGEQGQELQRVMKPLAQAASVMPPMAFRADPFVLATTLGRYFPYLLQVDPE